MRLLRSQRIRLLHCYCREVLKDAYFDLMKVQTLETLNALKRFTMLFPREDNFFEYGLGLIQDCLPHAFVQDNPKFSRENPPVYTVQSLLSGEALFYVPSIEEVLKLDPVNRPHAGDNILPGGDFINESLIDQQIKDLVKVPSLSPTYKRDDWLPRPLRLVRVADAAYTYSQPSYKLLTFLTLLYRNLKLRYLMVRNSSSAFETLELEDQVLNGRPYWESLVAQTPAQGSCSQRVIEMIIARKRGRQGLMEDMRIFSQRLQQMRLWLEPKGGFDRLVGLLSTHHQLIFKRFLLGVEQALDTQVDEAKDEVFQKVMEVRDALVRKVPAFRRFYENGVNLNQMVVHPMGIDLATRSLLDNSQHEQVYSAYVDEQRLMPSEISLVRSLFSKHTLYESQCYSSTSPLNRDYSYLESSFFNLSDKQRQYLATCFQSLDDKLRLYLKYRRLSLLDTPITQVLSAELDYVQTEVEARHLQHVMLCWIGRSDVPRNTKDYKALYKRFRDQTVLRVLAERDQILAGEQIRIAAEEERQRKREQAVSEDPEL